MDGLLWAIAIGIAVLIWRSFFPGYLTEKGKNLATKEDIEVITDKIEGVRAQYTADLERHRSELNRIAFEHSTRFSKLHERRVEAIDGMYKRLVRTMNAFYPLLISGEEEKEDVQRRASEAAQEFVTFFGENRLYLEPELAAALGEVQRVMQDCMGYIRPRLA